MENDPERMIVPENRPDGWYVVDGERDYRIHGGPYKCGNSAAVARAMMEKYEPKRTWNLMLIPKGEMYEGKDDPCDRIPEGN